LPIRFATAWLGLLVACPALAQVAAAAPTPGATAPAHAPEAEAEIEAEAAEPDDGWPDISDFLDEKFGFLPMVRPITEPAIGYGAAGGLIFLSKSFGDMSAGLGRPNITFVGGMGTSSKTWGVFAGDTRYWLRDHLQTLAAGIYASVNLDFYGVGKTDALADNPLRYNLEPKGGLLQAKYRFGTSNWWAGANARFMSTAVTFEASDATPGLPDYARTSNLGGVSALAAFDSRDTAFTPTRGTYADLSIGVFGEGPQSEGPIERVELQGIQYIPLPWRLYLGVRGFAAATFGEAPFYFRPYVGMRGVPQLRYQGDEVAQAELELRWQFWGRWSVLGFVGGGGAWNQLEQFEAAQGVVAGGGGFRYEIARKYGIHLGVDVAFSPDTAAFYIQVGSAWMRP
jgi:hypothetical protein